MNKKAFYMWMGMKNSFAELHQQKNESFNKRYKFPDYYLGVEDGYEKLEKLIPHLKSFDEDCFKSYALIEQVLHESDKYVIDANLYKIFGGINVMQKYAKEIKPFIPSDKTYLEISGTENITDHLIIHKIPENEDHLFFATATYDKSKKQMHADPCIYCFDFSRYESWADLIVKPESWKRNKKDKYTFIPDTKNMKVWDSMPKFWDKSKAGQMEQAKIIWKIFTQLFFLNFLLTYKNITKEKTQNGRSNKSKLISKSYKNSEILQAPTYEHKTLTIDLEDDKHYQEANSSTEYKPKKWHMVRGHLRKLASGDVTFVRHHSRGNAAIGTVTKDYKIGG